jgi:hypothetical protein
MAGNRIMIVALYSDLDGAYDPDDYSGYTDDVDDDGYSLSYLYLDLRGLCLS